MDRVGWRWRLDVCGTGDESQRALTEQEGEKDAQSVTSTPLNGKLTIVGFFSSTKEFFVNRLMCRIKNGGSLVILNLRRTPPAS